MVEPFIGQINTVGFNFAPRGWALCEGQLLPISQNTALFSLLGTTYGGDGRTTFGLPDLRGRNTVGVGQGAGLNHISWGEKGGSNTTVLTKNNLPSHNHSLTGAKASVTVSIPASDTGADGNNPEDAHLAESPATTNIYKSDTPNVTLAPFPADGDVTGITQDTGASTPIDNMQPFLGVYYVIALVGIFPSRS